MTYTPTSRKRAVLVGAVAAAVVLVATACYPPGQTPVTQQIPPGGRVVATLPALTATAIASVSDDLSMIAYSNRPFDGSPHNPFWLYDDDTGTTTLLPNGAGDGEGVAVSPDGRSVVFSSNDPNLQVGPTSVNCRRGGEILTPITFHYCDELYLYDVETGTTRQLTGLGGSSTRMNLFMSFTDDGTAIVVMATDSLQWGGNTQYFHVDLATGEITDAAVPQTSAWDRGTHRVVWNADSGTLTSEDLTSGDVTTLWSDPRGFLLERVVDDGRFLVLSHRVSDTVEDQTQIFRLVDTDTGVVRDVPSQWISIQATRYAVVQQNVAPEGFDRLIIAPILN